MWASVGDDVAAAGAVVGAATGAAVGFAAGAAVGAGAGGVVGAGAAAGGVVGAAVGCGGALGPHATSSVAAEPRTAWRRNWRLGINYDTPLAQDAHTIHPCGYDAETSGR